MKAVLSLTLIVCLVMSALPLTAQEKTETAGPLSRPVVRQPARLGGADEPTTRLTEPAQTGGNPAVSDWSRVRALARGIEVVVTLKGASPSSRYFVLANEFELGILNLTDPALPQAATRVLLDMVARHPEYFVSPTVRGTLESNGVRVGPDGVFVAGQKVGDLDQVVERVAQTDVFEIRRPVPKRSVARGVGWGLGGYFVGGMAGGFIGAAIHCGIGRCEDNIPTGASVGLLAGAVAGAIVGYRKGARTPHPKPEDVIYRVP